MSEFYKKLKKVVPSQQQKGSNFKNINSPEYFEINWLCWKLLGAVPPTPSAPENYHKRIAYFIWSFVINTISTIAFPIHLLLNTLLNEQMDSELYGNVAIFVTSLATSLKFYIYFSKFHKMRQMEMLLRIMDSRIQRPEERWYYETYIRRNLNQLKHLFQITYLIISTSSTMAFVFSTNQRLFYPGWMPFDWHASWTNYIYAIAYQFVCVFFIFIQNFANDIFSSKALCLLSGHIQILYIRVAHIGHDHEQTPKEHERELNRCVVDQMHLYELHEVIENIISWPMLLQFIVSVVNCCVAMVALIYFVPNILDKIYYVSYIAGIIILEVFPTCYYGSDFVLLFERLHYAVFSCNWLNQTKSFKRSMMIFTERSLKPTQALAGGLVRIHLDTFFAVCKMTYSLFTVVLSMKK